MAKRATRHYGSGVFGGPGDTILSGALPGQPRLLDDRRGVVLWTLHGAPAPLLLGGQ